MSFEDYKKYLNKLRSITDKRYVSILGGEPTLHPQFDEIVRYTADDENLIGMSIFSNLFGINSNTIETIKHMFRNVKDSTLIWNNSEIEKFSEKKYLEIEDSIIEIVNEFYPSKIAMALTVTDFDDVKEFEYIVETYKRLGIYRLRFAVDINSQSKFIGNSKIYVLLKYLLDYGIEVSPDRCGYLLRCYFNDRQFDEICHRVKEFYMSCEDGTSEGDVLPNGTLIPCLPYMDSDSTLNIMDIKDLNDIPIKFSSIYGTDVLKDFEDKSRDKMCNDCNHLKLCRGICPYV